MFRQDSRDTNLCWELCLWSLVVVYGDDDDDDDDDDVDDDDAFDEVS